VTSFSRHLNLHAPPMEDENDQRLEDFLVEQGNTEVCSTAYERAYISSRLLSFHPLALLVPNSTRTGRDQTKSADLSETRADPTDFVVNPGL